MFVDLNKCNLTEYLKLYESMRLENEALRLQIDVLRSSMNHFSTEDEKRLADSERLDWIERAARKSPTGISFDYIPSVDREPSGFRFMRKFFIGDTRDSLRSAIDAAHGEVEQFR